MKLYKDTVFYKSPFFRELVAGTATTSFSLTFGGDLPPIAEQVSDSGFRLSKGLLYGVIGTFRFLV